MAAIEKLQPGAGCEWTARLRDLSNPDKHRRLTILAHESEHDVKIKKLVDDARGLPQEEAVDVKLDLSSKVAFDDGLVVIPTLQHLKEEVASVVEAFDSEF